MLKLAQQCYLRAIEINPTNEVDLEGFQVLKILLKEPNERTTADIELLIRTIRKIKFFRDLVETEQDEGILEQFSTCMTYETHPKEKEVITINTIGDKFYIILSGSVSVHIKKSQDDLSETPELKQVAIMGAGLSFGEIALISNRPRLATIICEENSQFLILNKKNFDKCLKNKKALNQKLTYIESIPFLTEVNKGYVRDIYSRSTYVTYVNKQPVFNEGDMPEAVYIVIKGCFKATKIFYMESVQENDMSQKRLQEKPIEELKAKERKRESKTMQITTYNKNEYFGEEDLAEGSRCGYSVVCESVEGELLVFKKGLFMGKVMGDPRGKKYILDSIEQKRKVQQAKFAQIQTSINRFWKFLKEDREQLKNDLQLQQESKKRFQIYRKPTDILTDSEDDEVAPLPLNSGNGASAAKNRMIQRRETVDALSIQKALLSINTNRNQQQEENLAVSTSPSPVKRRGSLESPIILINEPSSAEKYPLKRMDTTNMLGSSAGNLRSSKRQLSLIKIFEAQQQQQQQGQSQQQQQLQQQQSLGSSQQLQIPQSVIGSQTSIDFVDFAFRKQSLPIGQGSMRKSALFDSAPKSMPMLSVSQAKLNRNLTKIVTDTISAMAEEKLTGQMNLSQSMTNIGSSANISNIFQRSSKKKESMKIDLFDQSSSAKDNNPNNPASANAKRPFLTLRQQRQQKELLTEQIRMIAGLKEVRALPAEEQKKLIANLFQQEPSWQQQFQQQAYEEDQKKKDSRYRSEETIRSVRADDDQMNILLQQAFETREIQASTYEQFKDILHIPEYQTFDLRPVELQEKPLNLRMHLHHHGNNYNDYLTEQRNSHNNGKAYTYINNKFRKRHSRNNSYLPNQQPPTMTQHNGSNTKYGTPSASSNTPAAGVAASAAHSDSNSVHSPSLISPSIPVAVSGDAISQNYHSAPPTANLDSAQQQQALLQQQQQQSELYSSKYPITVQTHTFLQLQHELNSIAGSRKPSMKSVTGFTFDKRKFSQVCTSPASKSSAIQPPMFFTPTSTKSSNNASNNKLILARNQQNAETANAADATKQQQSDAYFPGRIHSQLKKGKEMRKVLRNYNITSLKSLNQVALSSTLGTSSSPSTSTALSGTTLVNSNTQPYLNIANQYTSNSNPLLASPKGSLTNFDSLLLSSSQKSAQGYLLFQDKQQQQQQLISPSSTNSRATSAKGYFISLRNKSYMLKNGQPLNEDSAAKKSEDLSTRQVLSMTDFQDFQSNQRTEQTQQYNQPVLTSTDLLQQPSQQRPSSTSMVISSITRHSMRPYSAVSKEKVCQNAFFNTINANNFLKSSQIKRKRLLTDESNKLTKQTVSVMRPKTSNQFQLSNQPLQII